MASSVESRVLQAPEGSRLVPSLPNPQVTDLQPQGGNSVNLMQVALNRLPLLLIGLVAGIIGGFFYHLRVVPTFQTTLSFSVAKKKGEMSVAGDSRTSYLDDFVAVQLAVIKSPSVMEKAAEILESEASSTFSLDSLGGSPRPTAPASPGSLDLEKSNQTLVKLPQGATSKSELASIIHSGLTPNKDEKQGILILTYKTSRMPEESQKIISAVFKGYQKYLDDLYNIANDNTIKNMDAAIATTNNELLKFQTEYRTKQEQLKKIHPTGVVKVYEQLEASIAKMEASILDWKDRIQELDARNGGASGLIRPGRSGDSEGSMQFLPANEMTINSLKLEKKLLLIDYGKDHPKVRKVTMQIEHLEELKQAQSAKGSDGFVSTNPYEREKEYLKSKIEKADEAIQEALSKQKVLKEDTEIERELDGYCKDLAKKIETFSRKLENIEDLRRTLALTKDQGGYEARQISRIVGPFPSGVNRFVYLFIGGVMGLGAGFGLAYLAEITDKSFQTPDEIRRQLGHSILGHIPTIRINEEDRKPGSRLEAQLCTFHKPKSTEAEAYRGLRTGLYFSTQNKGHQVIQITSPNAGDGKSTLSCNLSISIAQSGKKVVLIDADMRKPRVHKIFGLENQAKGLSTLIEGTSTFDESTLATDVPNLFLIPCGPRPANPAELLTVPRFPQLLEELRQLYDIVIVDTPPLLAVSDPCIVAPRVDGVILNILLNKNARTCSVRACEMLASIDAKVLGLVINCFDSKMRAGSYGYSYSYGYRYSYKYGYRYGYGYNYGYSDYAQYSDDVVPGKNQLGSNASSLKPRKKQ